jgi:hypothetical protein
VSGGGAGDVGRLADPGAVVQIHGETRFGLVSGARGRCTAREEDGRRGQCRMQNADAGGNEEGAGRVRLVLGFWHQEGSWSLVRS